MTNIDVPVLPEPDKTEPPAELTGTTTTLQTGYNVSRDRAVRIEPGWEFGEFTVAELRALINKIDELGFDDASTSIHVNHDVKSGGTVNGLTIHEVTYSTVDSDVLTPKPGSTCTCGANGSGVPGPFGLCLYCRNNRDAEGTET